MFKARFGDRILAPFTRVTSSGRYLPEVDGLRCLAIVLVVFFHCHHLFRNFFIYSILQPHVFSRFVIEGNWPWNFLSISLMLLGCLILSGLLFLDVEKPFARGKLPQFRKRVASPGTDCNSDTIN